MKHMSDYDFSQLNDKEFEQLCCDLLGVEEDRRVERFKPGKDQGVDGRFFTPNGGEAIMQAKHYLRSGYSAFLKKLETEELEKVKKLDPERYCIMTSLPLSLKNKRDILSKFSPYIISESDIYGQEDLNDIISTNPEVEERHYKLWITSTTVLKRVLNEAIVGRSRSVLAGMAEKAKLYVQTAAHEQALSLLEKHHVVILSGEPGIGKTTLAGNLCLYYRAKDFEFFDVQGSVSEAENVYDKRRKQVFLCDDFLGSNYLEAIHGKQDSHIVQFINRVRRDKSQRFILTSRTNILTAGVYVSPIFKNENLRRSELLLDIKDLEPVDRAWILYNHMWFSALDQEFIDEIYKNRRYLEVVNHRNFNPRLIEFVLDVNRVSIDQPTEYWEYIEKTLDNPKDIWRDSFKWQTNSSIRNIVTLIVFNGGSISESALRSALHRYRERIKYVSPSHVEDDFSTAAQLATGSFINRELKGNSAHYSLFNPSIADFILAEYGDDDNKVEAVFSSLRSGNAANSLVAMLESHALAVEDPKALLRNLVSQGLRENLDPEYLLVLVWELRKEHDAANLAVSVLQHVINEKPHLSNAQSFFELAGIFSDQVQIDDVQFIDTIGTGGLDLEGVESFGKFVDTFALDDEGVLYALEESFNNALEEHISHYVQNMELSDYEKIWWDEDGGGSCLDEEKIVEAVKNELESRIEDADFECATQLSIDMELLVDNSGIEDAMQSWEEAQRDQYRSEYSVRRRPPREEDQSSAIEDIFQRA